MLNEGEAAFPEKEILPVSCGSVPAILCAAIFSSPISAVSTRIIRRYGSRSINSTSIGCAELLENGQAELIVTNYPNSRLSAHTKLQTVLEFRDIFVANPDYFTMGKSPLSMENLLDYPILMLAPKSTTSEYLHQVFAAQGLKLLPEVELNSNDLLIDLAEIGLGIACIPDYMLRNRPGLEPVHLKTPLPARSAVIAHHEALQLSQAAQCFLKYFSQI